MLYFELMVTAAIWQGIKWHMWLHYYPHFLERLVETFDGSDPNLSPYSETPTRGTELIAEIVRNLLGWITVVEDLPATSVHKKPSSTKPDFDNANIPKAAAVALGACFKYLLEAPHLPTRLLDSLHSSVMRHIRNLRPTTDGEMRQLLINCIIRRGITGPDAMYGARLKGLFSGTDHVLKAELQDYEQALHAEYGP